MIFFEKAEEIANNGMQEKEVFKFFTIVSKEVPEIESFDFEALFYTFGIPEEKTLELYEKWQEE